MEGVESTALRAIIPSAPSRWQGPTSPGRVACNVLRPAQPSDATCRRRQSPHPNAAQRYTAQFGSGTPTIAR